MKSAFLLSAVPIVGPGTSFEQPGFRTLGKRSYAGARKQM